MQTEQAYKGYRIAFERGKYRAAPAGEDEIDIEIVAEGFTEVTRYIDQMEMALEAILAGDPGRVPGWVQTWMRVGQRVVSPASTEGFSSLLATMDLIVDDTQGEIPTYRTDAEGYIDYYNDAAAQLWGRRPELGVDRWCGCYKSYSADGKTSIDPANGPLKYVIQDRKPWRGGHAIVERPDGTRRAVKPHLSPLLSDDGVVIGTINYIMVVDEKVLVERR